MFNNETFMILSSKVTFKLIIFSLLIGFSFCQHLGNKCDAKNQKRLCQHNDPCLCFTYEETKKSWQDAKESCQQKGGWLASLQNNVLEELSPWLKEVITESNPYLLVGLQKEEGSSWKWTHYNKKVDKLDIYEDEESIEPYPTCAFLSSDVFSRRAAFYASKCQSSWDEKGLPVMCRRKKEGQMYQKYGEKIAHMLFQKSWVDPNYQYFITEFGKDRWEASEICKQLDGEVFSISSSDQENKDVYPNLEALRDKWGFKTIKLWIGLQKKTDKWKWENGQELLENFEDKRKRQIFWGDNEPADIKRIPHYGYLERVSRGGLPVDSESLNHILVGRGQRYYYDKNPSDTPYLCENYIRVDEKKIEIIDLKNYRISDKLNKLEGLRMVELIESEIHEMLQKTSITNLQLIKLAERMKWIEMMKIIHDRKKKKSEPENLSSHLNEISKLWFSTEKGGSLIGKSQSVYVQLEERKTTLKSNHKFENIDHYKQEVRKMLRPFENLRESLQKTLRGLEDIVVEPEEINYDLHGETYAKTRKQYPKPPSKPHLADVHSSDQLLFWIVLTVATVVAAVLACVLNHYFREDDETNIQDPR
ncbi:hypothetical protein QYM36_009106 [Artemia franciscana]|uniref:C-type lectin domain-containing protein n=1 Tax=Artemia franciscana TaxID=6661 RepID=A0AA88HMZ0_ARTSF|nr:hypothetical protein QYM36_009106 [Artemia franciscana]